MARKPRVHFPGAIYHVMARGNDGQDVFHDDWDRRFFLSGILELKTALAFNIYAYCLMTNHFHLLLQVDQVPLSVIMQRLLGRYSRRSNWRREATGHVFQARYQAILCPRDSYFCELLRYIHLNPVRAGLVGNPEAWAWSGHNQLANLSRGVIDIDFPLAQFGDEPSAAAALYKDFVMRGINQPLAGVHPISEEDAQRRRQRLYTVALRVAGDEGVLKLVLEGNRRHDLRKIKTTVATAAVAEGYSCDEIAELFGRSASMVRKLLGRTKNSHFEA